MVPAVRVSPMLVVVVQPTIQLASVFGLRRIAAGVSPTITQSAVEPLDLAVGLRPIRPSALVPDAQLGTRLTAGYRYTTRKGHNPVPTRMYSFILVDRMMLWR